MKIIAIIANLAFLIFLIGLVVVEEVSKNDAPIMFFFCLLPILNVIAFLSLGKGKDFFSLYFKRKNLEQELKIKELQNNIKRESNNAS